MDTALLDREKFEGVKILADIGTKIAAGRAALVELEAGKRDFLDGRTQEAIDRVAAVVADSKALLEECSKYHSELVSFRTQISEYVADVRELIQSVERWKGEFDNRLDAENNRIRGLLSENREILTHVKAQRALLEGETQALNSQRRALKEEKLKIDDEWATLGRAKKEING